MSTRIQREFNFTAGIYFSGKFFMTMYTATLFMELVTEDHDDQQIGLERIKYLFETCFSDSIFIKDTEHKAIETLVNIGMKVSTLPVEPYDQVVAMAIFSKVNAITENKYYLTDIQFGSHLSDGVTYMIDFDDNFGPLEADGFWWKNSNMHVSDVKKSTKKDKIVKLHKLNSNWSDVELGWKINPETTELANTIPINKNSEVLFLVDTENNTQKV